MTEKQIISWIFLATALAAEAQPTDINGISQIADGINHAVPTQKELQLSISFLIARGLINKQGKKYGLTIKGKQEYAKASENTNTLFEIWQKLELNSFN